MIEIGDSKVTQMQIGENTIYKNSGDWIQLDLTKVALDGSVFFHDNENGTASLAGSARYDFSKKSKTKVPVLLPPEGYKFTGVDWNANPYANGILGSRGLSGSSNGVGVYYTATVEDGNVVFETSDSSHDYSITILFARNRTVKSVAEDFPAIVNIEKVKES